MIIQRCLALALATGALGCGGVANAGGGSATLRVNGDVSATELTNNASGSAQFRTELTVRVSKAGAPLRGASVVIRSSCGTVTLDDSMDGGTYRAIQPGYCQTYSLDVTSGADQVTGVTLAGPAIHTIANPAQGQTVDARLPLVVRWSPSGASMTEIETREFSSQSNGDSGSFEIAVGRLRAEAGRTTDERVRVRRLQRIVPAGAVADSSFVVSVRNQVEFGAAM